MVPARMPPTAGKEKPTSGKRGGMTVGVALGWVGVAVGLVVGVAVARGEDVILGAGVLLGVAGPGVPVRVDCASRVKARVLQAVVMAEVDWGMFDLSCAV